jgi:hypothetical protein
MDTGAQGVLASTPMAEASAGDPSVELRRTKRRALAAAITEDAARLLTNPAALATAKNPHGDGRGTERTLEAIRRASLIRADARAVC